jgi:hypothetical protein
MSRPKVIQIGFNKTGTTSLARFFKKNGYAVVGGEVAIRVQKNIDKQRKPFKGIDFDLAQDLENHRLGIYVYEQFELIHRHYPDAKFVLTTRSCEKWIKSRLSHNGGRYVRRALRRLELCDIKTLCDYWRHDFYTYHSKVINHFSGSGNLYIHALECLDISGLVDFLGPSFTFHDCSYPHSNQKRNKVPVSYSLEIED